MLKIIFDSANNLQLYRHKTKSSFSFINEEIFLRVIHVTRREGRKRKGEVREKTGSL